MTFIKKNKNAGFWIRFCARFIDVLIPSLIMFGAATLMIEKNVTYDFRQPILFYVWSILFITLILTFSIIIPLFFHNKSFGMFIFRLEYRYENKKWTSIIKREFLVSLTWAFIIFMIMIFVNHTLIGKFAQNNQKSIPYTDWERVRISVVSIISAFMMILQLMCGISILVHNDKRGMHDRIAKMSVVYTNKFVTITKDEIPSELKPRPVNNTIIEWI